MVSIAEKPLYTTMQRQNYGSRPALICHGRTNSIFPVDTPYKGDDLEGLKIRLPQ